jgi:hypothetical protein
LDKNDVKAKIEKCEKDIEEIEGDGTSATGGLKYT